METKTPKPRYCNKGFVMGIGTNNIETDMFKKSITK